MAKEKKFVVLFEDYMRRFERGGFLVGDVFKFNDNFKSDEQYKKLGTNVQELIDQMIDSGLHVRVVGIKNEDPSVYPGNSQTAQLEPFLDIALDSGGGRYTHYVSVPCCLGQPVQYAPNLLPIPDAMRRNDKVTIKPEEAEEDKENLSNKTDKGNGELSDTERSLPTSNTAIPSDPVTPSPAVSSYTKEYLTGLNR